MARITFLCLCLFFMFLSCSREEEPMPRSDETKRFYFGWYFGLCRGKSCVEFYQIANGKLYEDILDHYPDLSGSMPIQAEFVPRSQEDYEAVKDLPLALPGALFEEEERVLGQPDAGDWGGLYVGLQEGEDLKWRYIDNKEDNVPEYLHEFMGQVREAIERLQE